MHLTYPQKLSIRLWFAISNAASRIFQLRPGRESRPSLQLTASLLREGSLVGKRS